MAVCRLSPVLPQIRRPTLGEESFFVLPALAVPDRTEAGIHVREGRAPNLNTMKNLAALTVAALAVATMLTSCTAVVTEPTPATTTSTTVQTSRSAVTAPAATTTTTTRAGGY